MTLVPSKGVGMNYSGPASQPANERAAPPPLKWARLLQKKSKPKCQGAEPLHCVPKKKNILTINRYWTVHNHIKHNAAVEGDVYLLKHNYW